MKSVILELPLNFNHHHHHLQLLQFKYLSRETALYGVVCVPSKDQLASYPDQTDNS